MTQTEIILASVAGLSFLLSLFAVYNWYTLNKRHKELFNGESGKKIEEKLHGYLDKVKKVESDQVDVRKVLNILSNQSNKSLQKVSFMRYNPYGDVGGDQSFSICVLDLQNNGYIVSSLHNRESTRVYGKKVVAGVSQHSLAKEEEQVLGKAISPSN